MGLNFYVNSRVSTVLRTRAEALALRAAFSMRSFQLSAQETSPSSVVTDTIRKLDLESARFSKLISTLPSNVEIWLPFGKDCEMCAPALPRTMGQS